MEAQSQPTQQLPAPETNSAADEAQQKKMVIGIVITVIVILGLLIAGIVFLATTPNMDTVTRVRDIFIIFLALESFVIGVALVILMIQLARLINLLNNEIKPIIDSTNETVSHLRGTTVFLSENLSEPIIKLNEYMAGLTQALQMLGLVRKKPKS